MPTEDTTSYTAMSRPVLQAILGYSSYSSIPRQKATSFKSDQHGEVGLQLAGNSCRVADRPPARHSVQVVLLWQRDRATRLSVEILQLQNIPIVWHYLRDPTFSRFYTIPECDRHTHRDGRTDTRRRHVLR